MLKAFIVDDEGPALDLLEILLSDTGRVEVVGRFIRPLDVLPKLHALKPDVVFLDIEMPGCDGLELAARINTEAPDTEIVFVTAYNQYALEAFRVNALSYLLKPVQRQELAKTVARLARRNPPAPQQTDAGVGYIECFGGFTVYADAAHHEPLKWRTAKARELFAYLYQNRNRQVPKWEVGDALWPELEDARMSANLHTAFYQMKKTLHNARIMAEISYAEGRYRLRDSSGLSSDAAEFDAVFKGPVRVTAQNAPGYERAVRLYRADYMDGTGYLWALPVCEHLRACALAAIQGLARYRCAQDQPEAAVQLLLRGLQISPLDETAHAALLELYQNAGDRAAYIRHYRAMEKLLREELGIGPRPALTRQYLLYTGSGHTM
ncbi:MAG TPA: response regulator [Feifaniaceae bacterium]|nr:response regulator [Feifaniaceae bacterium]